MPDSVIIPRNGAMNVEVGLSDLIGTATITVSGSDGQVTVTPLAITGPATSPFRFNVRVKRQSRTVAFSSPCGPKPMRVVVQ